MAKEHLHHTAANLVLQAVVAEGNMLEPATKIQLVIHGVSLMLTSKNKHPSRRKSYKMKLILEGHEELSAAQIQGVTGLTVNDIVSVSLWPLCNFPRFQAALSQPRNEKWFANGPAQSCPTPSSGVSFQRQNVKSFTAIPRPKGPVLRSVSTTLPSELVKISKRSTMFNNSINVQRVTKPEPFQEFPRCTMDA